jgi:hypothetical protein
MAYIPSKFLIINSPPENALFISSFYNKFDIGADGFKIINVEPFFYQGEIATSPFLAITQNTLWLALKFNIDEAHDSTAVTRPSVRLFDELGGLSFIAQNDQFLFVENHGNNYNLSNNYFSYLTFVPVTGYLRCKFIGYKVTYNFGQALSQLLEDFSGINDILTMSFQTIVVNP